MKPPRLHETGSTPDPRNPPVGTRAHSSSIQQARPQGSASGRSSNANIAGRWRLRKSCAERPFESCFNTGLSRGTRSQSRGRSASPENVTTHGNASGGVVTPEVVRRSTRYVPRRSPLETEYKRESPRADTTRLAILPLSSSATPGPAGSSAHTNPRASNHKWFPSAEKDTRLAPGPTVRAPEPSRFATASMGSSASDPAAKAIRWPPSTKVWRK